MTNKVFSVNREWLHEWILEPYLEGAERVNRAWLGINLHSLNQNRYTPIARLFSFFVGAALMTPMINTVIWVFWKAFGAPEHLSDPYRA